MNSARRSGERPVSFSKPATAYSLAKPTETAQAPPRRATSGDTPSTTVGQAPAPLQDVATRIRVNMTDNEMTSITSKSTVTTSHRDSQDKNARDTVAWAVALTDAGDVRVELTTPLLASHSGP